MQAWCLQSAFLSDFVLPFPVSFEGPAATVKFSSSNVSVNACSGKRDVGERAASVSFVSVLRVLKEIKEKMAARDSLAS